MRILIVDIPKSIAHDDWKLEFYECICIIVHEWLLGDDTDTVQIDFNMMIREWFV